MHNLGTVFSLDNLTQASTIKAIAGFAVALILIFYPPGNPLTPDQVKHLTDQAQVLIGLIFASIAGLSKILAAYHGVVATINLLYNERKRTTIMPVITTAPVAVTVEKAP